MKYRALRPTAACVSALCLTLIGCGGSDESSAKKQPDAGTQTGGSSGTGGTGGAGGTSGSGGSGGSAGAADAATDAEVDAGTDAGDASADAGADASTSTHDLYALIAKALVKIDTKTGGLTERGLTPYTFLSLAWDETTQVARVIYDIDDAASAKAKLGTVDLCTGAVTAGPELTLSGGAKVTYAEGLVQQPGTGTFFVSYRNSGTQSLTARLGTVVPATGVVTPIGNISSLQNDGDMLTFVGSSLYLLDVLLPTKSAVYSTNLATAQTSLLFEVGPEVVRIAYAASDSRLYAALGSPDLSIRGIAEMNPTTGAMTNIGSPLKSTDYPGTRWQSLLVTPPISCP